jgi:homoserine dehydrogenase
MREIREIGVGLLGLGNVGAGVVKLLEDNAAAISLRLGARVVLRAIAVRAPTKKNRLVDVDEGLLTTDLDAVIDRPDVDIVCELIGGEKEARRAVLRAIDRRKHVVTANKALLAVHGDEVFAAAEAKDVDVYYEAAVCGGVPIIRVLREGLASDRVEHFYGIVNGTSNFILTKMTEEGRPFAEILGEAQAAGYAEADPTLDVDGTDAAHKLAILTMLCFGTRVDVAKIYKEGIDRLHPIDFHYAEKFGYVIKPLVVAREHPQGIEARVHPAFVPANWLLADVPGPKNAVYVQSHALGPSMYYGAGAGMMPTAMAVVSDIIEISRNILGNAAGFLVRGPGRLETKPFIDIADVRSRYYMRFGVLDRPGVLGQLTTILGEHQISIAQVVQEGPREPERPVRVVVLTHEAREGNMRLALAQINKLSAVVDPAAVVRIAQ